MTHATKETTSKAVSADPKETSQQNKRMQPDEQSGNLLPSSNTPATTTAKAGTSAFWRGSTVKQVFKWSPIIFKNWNARTLLMSVFLATATSTRLTWIATENRILYCYACQNTITKYFPICECSIDLLACDVCLPKKQSTSQFYRQTLERHHPVAFAKEPYQSHHFWKYFVLSLCLVLERGKIPSVKIEWGMSSEWHASPHRVLLGPSQLNVKW